MGDSMQPGSVPTVPELFELAAKHGLLITRIAVGDLRMTLIPKELATLPVNDPKAPKEMPDSFDELPIPNWQDPAEKPNTEETRKRAELAQELADEEVFGAKIPTQD
jgi:hypothetical protein